MDGIAQFEGKKDDLELARGLLKTRSVLCHAFMGEKRFDFPAVED